MRTIDGLRTADARLFVVLLAAGLSAGMPPAVQTQSAQTFRATTDLVLLDVVVLDDERRPVTGLTAADFTVLDEAEVRDIQAFAAVELRPREPPAGASWTGEIAPDVVTNDVADEGRLVVIVMDRSISAGPATDVARQIARTAIDALGPTDLAAVVTSTGFANEGMVQNFTRDRLLLADAIDASFIGLVSPPQMGPGGLAKAPPELQFSGDCLCGTCVTGTLVRVADAMARVERRQKVLLFIGTDIVIQDPPMGASMCSLLIKEGREQALRSLDRANVTVHAIDPSGLETLQANAESAAPRDASTAAGNLRRQANLGVFPDYTGGRVVLNTNAPDEVVPRIFAETQSYYLIGFARADDGEAGEQREVRVRVNRDDVTVRSRRGYFTAASEVTASAPTPADAALGALLPRNAIPLSMTVTPRFQVDGATMVDVHVGISSGDADALADKRTFDVVVGVFDDRARPLGTERQVVEVPAEATTTTPVNVHAHLPLGPGRYEVRVGVAERGSGPGRAGSVYGYVTVPEDAAPATLGGLVLAAMDPGGAAGVAMVPTHRRAFTRRDVVSVLAQIRTSSNPRPELPIRLSLTDARDARVSSRLSRVSSSAFNAAGVAEVVLSVPLEGLSAGEYLLTVEADVPAGVQRQHLRFQVE